MTTKRAAVAALLLTHAGLLCWSAWRHAPTIDETAHLPAGIYYWRFGRFDLYRVNPPLVRLVAAIPVMAAGAKTNWAGLSAAPGARTEFLVGRSFLAENGTRSFWYFTLARWACIPFGLMGGYVCYRWSRELWGTAAGLVTLTLWCTSPDILGHAATIQADAPAATMAVAVTYLFRGWCCRPRFGIALRVGLVLGVALLVKTTLVLLLPMLPLLWLIRRSWVGSGGKRQFLREAAQLALTLLIAVDVLNAGYLFDGSFKPLGNYSFVSNALAGGSVGGDNRFSNTWMASLPIPLPEDYLLGIDAQRYDFEGHLSSYLRGETRDNGWWYYYLYGMAVKTPIGTLMLFAFALVSLIASGPGPASWRDVIFLALPALAVLVVVSSQTGMNNHVRYVLPCVPFLLILCGPAGRVLRPGRAVTAAGLLVAASLLGSVTSTLVTYPHAHSYFNELIGGPSHGHEQLLSSNVESGEDLLYLKDWMQIYAPGRPLKLAYYGNFDPRIAGIKFSLPPRLPGRHRRSILTHQDPGPLPGLHAVSVNYLHGPSAPVQDGRGGLSEDNDYSYFLEFEPTAWIGGGIVIYDMHPEEVKRVREKLGLTSVPEDLRNSKMP